MTSTAPNEDVKEKISCKLVSEIIRDRIKSDGTRFHANDNISKYILLSIHNKISKVLAFE